MPLPGARNHLAAVALNGRVYAIGGQNLWDERTGNLSRVDIYNPATNTWAAGPALPVGRGHTLASTVVFRNHIVVAGGMVDGDFTPTASVIMLAPGASQWTSLTSLPGVRQSPVAALIGTRLYLAGGNTKGLYAQTCHWWADLDRVIR